MPYKFKCWKLIGHVCILVRRNTLNWLKEKFRYFNGGYHLDLKQPRLKSTWADIGQKTKKREI
jgi:hypothetical protein